VTIQNFQGKTAVVTGAASGIGLGIAQRAASEGMNVVLADLEGDALREATKSVGESGARTLGVVTDVSRPDALRELADRTLEEFGAVHLLFNNAGVFAAGGPVWETPIADYEWQFAVNVMGVIHGIRTFVPILLEQGEESHIVNTASMAGLTTCPLSSAYYVSKHAALSLSETLYLELTQRGAPIGVSVLCPELVDTRIGNAERNRQTEFTRKDEDDDPEGEHSERELVAQAIRELTKTGVAPSALADRAFEAIRENRFYVLPPEDSSWRRACNSRLDDIRDQQNPTFVVTTSN